MINDKMSLLLLVPVVALITTPLWPFVNTPVAWLGIPVIVFWVGGWAVATSILLAFLYSREPELDDPSIRTSSDAQTISTEE